MLGSLLMVHIGRHPSARARSPTGMGETATTNASRRRSRIPVQSRRGRMLTAGFVGPITTTSLSSIAARISSVIAGGSGLMSSRTSVQGSATGKGSPTATFRRWVWVAQVSPLIPHHRPVSRKTGVSISGAQWPPDIQRSSAVFATTAISLSLRIWRAPGMSAGVPAPLERKVIMGERHCRWDVEEVN